MTCNEIASPALQEWVLLSRCGNMHMKVTAEQFELNGDKLTHRPTGGTFWMGDKDVVCCEPDYKLDELKDEAWRIMIVERKSFTSHWFWILVGHRQFLVVRTPNSDPCCWFLQAKAVSPSRASVFRTVSEQESPGSPSPRTASPYHNN